MNTHKANSFRFFPQTLIRCLHVRTGLIPVSHTRMQYRYVRVNMA